MKGDTIQIHGVTLSLTPEGSVEATIGGVTNTKSSSMESVLLYFLLREIQALNGALRETQPKVRGSTAGIFAP